jgi:hypothetical protein
MIIDLILIGLITCLVAVMIACHVVITVKINEIANTLNRLENFVDIIEYKMKNANLRKLSIKKW